MKLWMAAARYRFAPIPRARLWALPCCEWKLKRTSLYDEFSMTTPKLMRTLFSLVLGASPAFAQFHWIRLTSAHFEMYSTSDEKKSRDAILHFERVREFFTQVSPAKTTNEF